MVASGCWWLYDAVAHTPTAMSDAMLNSDVAKLLAPISKKKMLDTYANPALGEPWPTNWFAAPVLPDPTIGRKRRARRARGKLRQKATTTRPLFATVATSSAVLCWPGIKHSQWTSNQAQLIWSLSIIPEPALKRQFAYRIADLPV